MSEHGRRAIAWAVVVTAVLAAVWVKVRVEAGQSLQRAKTMEAKQDLDMAIVVYRHTVRWYSPGSGPVADAVERLQSIAETSEEAGEAERALLAWRALRSGLFAVRSFYQPYDGQITLANTRIAYLMARQEGSAPNDELARREAHHAELLATDHSPAVGWSLLAVFAFAAWIITLLGIATRAFDDRTGTLIRSAALRWSAASVVALALWMTGLSQA